MEIKTLLTSFKRNGHPQLAARSPL